MVDFCTFKEIYYNFFLEKSPNLSLPTSVRGWMGLRQLIL